MLHGVMRLPGCPFGCAWRLVCEVCWSRRLGCRCFQSFVFLGGARRLKISPSNTSLERLFALGEHPRPYGHQCTRVQVKASVQVSRDDFLHESVCDWICCGKHGSLRCAGYLLWCYMPYQAARVCSEPLASAGSSGRSSPSGPCAFCGLPNSKRRVCIAQHLPRSSDGRFTLPAQGPWHAHAGQKPTSVLHCLFVHVTYLCWCVSD